MRKLVVCALSSVMVLSVVGSALAQEHGEATVTSHGNEQDVDFGNGSDVTAVPLTPGDASVLARLRHAGPTLIHYRTDFRGEMVKSAENL